MLQWGLVRMGSAGSVVVLVVVFVVVGVRVVAFIVVGVCGRAFLVVGEGVVELFDIVAEGGRAFVCVCSIVHTVLVFILHESSLCDARVDSDESELESNRVFAGVLHFDLCHIFCCNVGLQVTPSCEVDCAFHNLGIVAAGLVTSTATVVVFGSMVMGFISVSFRWQVAMFQPTCPWCNR